MRQPVPPRVTDGLAGLRTDERRDAHFAALSLAVRHAHERHVAELVRLARSPKPANARIWTWDPAAPAAPHPHHPAVSIQLRERAERHSHSDS
jgi:hypothetical protein